MYQERSIALDTFFCSGDCELKGKSSLLLVTQELGVYRIYDCFLGIWLKENYQYATIYDDILSFSRS